MICKNYNLGKDITGGRRFVGKEFIVEKDGSIRISQEFYVKQKLQPIEISKERTRKKYSPHTPVEIDEHLWEFWHGWQRRRNAT